jgi:hypothetical protein
LLSAHSSRVIVLIGGIWRREGKGGGEDGLGFSDSVQPEKKRKKAKTAEGLHWREKAKSCIPGPNHMQLLGSSIFDVLPVFRIRPLLIQPKQTGIDESSQIHEHPAKMKNRR